MLLGRHAIALTKEAKGGKVKKRAYNHNVNVLRAGDYPFSIHKIYIPEHLNEMITKHSKEKDVKQFIKINITGCYCKYVIQTIIPCCVFIIN